ncbi:SusC/RagA family TonB-linked outer membrane protein [Hymenobacter psychrophilus]|uniref:TonB-linked outer membrane protein, SusC/RagA family n=1 Tax=Hymenobacter psychrophilus TaxID=651662 RepID=A0A1H3L8X2_9BACT|nr:TonB-dependent receptor [Hymenobacter psychrophilus]SDY60893.1 TonB-linked outer membrane protein, SusC/RagA family [Hymenobacter psychrophilus]
MIRLLSSPPRRWPVATSAVRALVLLLLLVCGPLVVQAQQGLTVSGTVVDAAGETLVGATVVVQGTTIGTSTNNEGFYSLQVPDGQGTLVFSFIGYMPLERAIKNTALLNATLKANPQSLEEVVVVGYGEVKRADLTGSVGSVNMDDLNKAPVKSFDDALAGRVAGVQVTSPDGQPGAAPNIVIRGGNSITQDNSPLYVVDGFPIENYNNNAINPSDIESIQILKDASSTAIYGSRGANGVVLITTKRGSDGTPTITYDTYFGLQESLSRAKLMKPYDFVKLQFDFDSVAARRLYLTNGRTLESYRDEEGIDWQKEILRLAPMWSHNLAVRGGSKGTRYSLSGSVLNQDGTIINSGFRRYQARVTLDQDVQQNLRVGLNANYSNIATTGTPVSGSSNSDFSLLTSLYGYRPIVGNGNLRQLLDNAEDEDVVGANNYQWNPLFTVNNEVRDRTTNQLTANGYAEYKFTKSLKLRVTGGVDRRVLRYDVFNNSQTRTGNLNNPNGQNGVNGSVTYTEQNNLVNENTLTYTKQIRRDHRLNVLGGFTVQRSRYSQYGNGAILIPNEQLGISGLDEGIPFTITAVRSSNTLASALSRVNYTFKDRYLATVSFRADGSSKFADGNKWSYFPSAALAWQLNKEAFLSNIKAISDAKLRVSYGFIGNNRVDDFAYLPSLGLPVGESYSPGGVFIRAVVPLTLGNRDLRWETTQEADLGFDLGLFEQRVTLTVDAYRKKTTDLLLNSLLPPTSGYTSAFQNIGAVQNQGLELTLGTVNVQSTRFNWSSNFNLAFNRNEVLELTRNQEFIQSSVRWQSSSGYGNVPAYLAEIGAPVARFYGFQWAGNYQIADFDVVNGNYVLKADVPNNGNARTSIRPGDIRYVDLNGDGQVDNSDRTIIGNPNPKFIGGFSNNFGFKGFDLNVFLQFSYGGDLLNANRILFEGGALKNGLNQFESYVDRWSPENPDSKNFRVGGQGPRVYSTRTIEDGSYLRLKTVNLGYTVPATLTSKAHLKTLRFYASAQNLLTWTKYSGNDPEVSIYSSPLTPGFDFSAYPRARTYTLGLNVSL